MTASGTDALAYPDIGYFIGPMTAYPLLAIAFVVGVIAICSIVSWSGWIAFAVRRKILSRSILAFLSLFVAIPLCSASGGLILLLPGKIAPESPHIGAMVIKSGLYQSYLMNEIMRPLSPAARTMVSCVAAVSTRRAQEHQKQCGDDRPCSETIPVMTRPALVAAIDQVRRSHASDETAELCRHADLGILTGGSH